MTMRGAERTATIVAVTRIAVGGAAFVAPVTAGTVLFGSTGARPGNRFLIRLIGVRDVVLGLGLLDALRKDEAASRLAAMGALSDAADAVLTALHPRVPRRVRAVAVPVSALSAFLGTWTAPRLRRK